MAAQAQQKHKPGAIRIIRYAVLALLAVLLVFGYQFAALYTDYQWFRELGQAQVFSNSFNARLQLFGGFGILFLLFVGFNLWLANRMNADAPRPRLLQPDQERMAEIARKSVFGLLMAGAVLMALVVGGNASSQWSDYLMFTRAGSFGVTDPVFNQDIGFYVFRLPFLLYVQGWALITIVAAGIGVGVINSIHRGLEAAAGGRPALAPSVRRHLLGLGGIAAIVVAWMIYLGRFALLNRDNNLFFGAGYTDVSARLPITNLSALLMLVVGALCFASMRTRNFNLVVGAGVAWALVSLLGGAVYPGFVQRFTVVPNQFGKEKDFLARSIALTQKAYGLDRVVVKDLGGSKPIIAADLAANRDTVNNIRLWDWPQLGAVYTNRQAVRPYYRFRLPKGSSRIGEDYNIDVDRYQIGGKLQQVMLGGREFYPEGLPQDAQTWQNRHLQYTHGYGVVMSPVNDVDQEGLPRYYLGQIPMEINRQEVAVARPQIYYGELTQDYCFVGTSQKEFDFPAGDGNVETSYAGKGGVPIGGMLNKLAWSMRLGDTNMLLSGEISTASRLLFRRNIRERVAALAPFLEWDNDPYLVVDGGKLVWIIDGYTITDRYPYSRPTMLGGPGGTSDFNYIRNSAKAVVDAYDGSVTLYQSDASDPIIRTWSRIFPGLLQPLDKMPTGLKAHLRYPEDLFRVQRDVYMVYHITDPRTFYGKEDAWEVPVDPTPEEEGVGTRMAPYYVVMRLPDGKDEEFVLMSQFTPRSKENLSAWMSARCDPEHYGQLVVYRYPKGSNVNGPGQIMSLVKRNEQISTFMTLQGQQGSRVIFGHLLVIPIGSELLYALPVYVQGQSATGNPLPLISKVIVASGDRVVMQNRLEPAIAALAGSSPEIASGGGGTGGDETGGGTNSGVAAAARPGAGPASGSAAAPPDPLTRAASAYDRARMKQREYNAALDELGRALKQLQEGQKAR